MPGSKQQESWIPEDFEPHSLAATVDAKTRAPAPPPKPDRPAPPPPANLAALRPSRPPAGTSAPAKAEATSPVRGSVRAKAPARPRPSARPPEARPVHAAPSTPSPPDGRFDLNEVGFEELRGAGLSITQARRLIAQREQRRGFRSLDDLDTVPGFPRDVIAALKRRSQV